MPPPLRSRRWLGAAAVLSAAALATFFLARSPSRTPTRPLEAVDPVVTPRSDRTRQPLPEPASSSVARTASSGAQDGHAHDRHPHPITPEHVRIQNDNQMLGALNDATDSKDVARLRQLVEVWQSKHDEDPEKFAEAYTVIADCLEFRNEESRAKARRFYDENRWSTLRRHIRRHCF